MSNDNGPSLGTEYSLASPEVAGFVLKHAQAASAAEIRSDAFTGSEHYAAGRMTHAILRDQRFSTVQAEVVHDALMAAFQAGYLAAAEGTSVDELLARMANL